MTGRVVTDGKHLTLEGTPLKVRGVTYGSFVPRIDGEPFPDRSQVKRDFAEMESAGLNVVRTYTLPPPDIVELVEEMGIRLIVGLHYEDWRYQDAPGRRAQRKVREAGRRAVDEAMRRYAGNPAILAIAVGNEVPSDVVRTYGIPNVEAILSELVAQVQSADPSMLATYCNFPTTEYLEIEGQDLICFNVFLEDPEAFRRYVRHLQIVSGDRPLVLTELGLASEIHGDAKQAESLEWQTRIADECGCAGATIFAWTDEWGVAGTPVENWGFGITDSDRNPKPAFDVVRGWAHSATRDLRTHWPRISAIVCAYNGDQLIEKCLTSLQNCPYPDLEVIVCDDGSTDRTLEIARKFPFRILELARSGLGAARNAGLEAATGEIVAFIDADAYCHPEWPYYLAMSLEDDVVVATGGPNLPVPTVGLVERAVASSPGGPIHVLVGDDRAEHVPGCNMAYSIEPLKAVRGFDPLYRAAGDDVDVCWKLLDRGYEIAFSAAAQVRHHRRPTVVGYLKQQIGYGRAERLLAGRHPHRFNGLGQARWSGFIYGGLRLLPSVLRPVVYHGYRGEAPYQKVLRRRGEIASSWAGALVPLLFLVAMAGLALLPFSAWSAVAVGTVLTAYLAYGISAGAAVRPARDEPHPGLLRMLVGCLHILQPLARAWGRLTGPPGPIPMKEANAWTGDGAEWIEELALCLQAKRLSVRSGRPDQDWDLQASKGLFMSSRIATAVTWGWVPHWHVQLRPRPQLVAGLVLSAVVATNSSLGGGVLALIIAVFSTVEAITLRRIVRSCLEQTTSEATE
jgi:glycosyltransferase involved in cell wall biosynthesis